jgi:hypothetical protein
LIYNGKIHFFKIKFREKVDGFENNRFSGTAKNKDEKIKATHTTLSGAGSQAVRMIPRQLCRLSIS